MLYPSIDTLLDIVDSKYALVVATARRARRLQESSIGMPGSSTTMNVSRALWEISDGTIRYERTESIS